jgi:ABC-2 type transport system permease protein
MKSRVDYSGRPNRKASLGAFWTIAEADLRGVLGSRITYGWVLVAVFIQVIRTLSSRGTGTAPSVVSSGLSDFVYIWALVLIGLAASSVSSEAGELADSIMSKSVTRLDYVLAKFASRVAYTLLTFALVTAVLVGLALRLEPSGADALGLSTAVLVVALTLALLTVLGVGLSIAMPNSVMAIVTLLVLWYAMAFFFPALGIGVLSPSDLMDRLPAIAGGKWTLEDWESVVGFLGISAASMALSSAYFYLKDI